MRRTGGVVRRSVLPSSVAPLVSATDSKAASTTSVAGLCTAVARICIEGRGDSPFVVGMGMENVDIRLICH
jgi:hypothetical protein